MKRQRIKVRKYKLKLSKAKCMDCFENNFSKIIVDNHSGCKLAKRPKEPRSRNNRSQPIVQSYMQIYIYIHIYSHMYTHLHSEDRPHSPWRLPNLKMEMEIGVVVASQPAKC